MYLIDKFTNKEIKLVENAGIYLEDRDYSDEELRKMERDITDYIMNHSTKNNVISKLQNDYESIYRTIQVK